VVGRLVRSRPESHLGTGDAFPSYDPEFRPGDNLFSASNIAIDVDTGKMKWYFQETPNEHWDMDTPNSKMLYEVDIGGTKRKVVGDFSRNGFYYTLDRSTGQFISANQFQEKVTWTAGIDAKTGRPVDYNPAGGVQPYAIDGGLRGKPSKAMCPHWGGAPTFYPPTFDADRMMAYAAAAEGCNAGTAITTPMDDKKDYVGQNACCFQQGPTDQHGAIWGMDVKTGKVSVKTTYEIASESGLASTKAGLLFHGHANGKFSAYDSDTLKELWNYNLGTPIVAPPITYAVGGKQYVAIVAGGSQGTGKLELYMPSAFVAVFGL
jgi:alcohol dehydrogenase (cytochrome c)